MNDLGPSDPPQLEEELRSCLEEAERGIEDALRAACRRRPDLAPDLVRRIGVLRAAGLLGPQAPRDAPTSTGPGSEFEPIGPYRPVRELGRGGQAVVYLAEDLRLHRPIALKVLKGLGAVSEILMRRFRREAEITSRLDHPGICPVFDAGVERGVPYIAMRYLEGRTLSEHVEAARRVRGVRPTDDLVAARARLASTVRDSRADPASESTPVGSTSLREVLVVTHLVEKAARALHAAHEAGVVHRDVKPGNILVSSGGEPVLLDFGLAGDEDGHLQSLTQTGEVFGTPAYMSPEQLKSQRVRVDRRSDVYSLGVTLYECLTLHKPFGGATREALYEAIQFRQPPDVRALNPRVSRDLGIVLATSMEKDPDRRYRTALEFAEDLRRVRERQPIAARPVGLLGRIVRQARLRPGRAAATVSAVLGCAALAALGGYAVATRPAVLAQEARGRQEALEAHLQAGFLALADGALAFATESFQSARRVDPSSVEALGGACLVLLRSGRHDEVAAVLDAAPGPARSSPAMDGIRVDALRCSDPDAAANLERSMPAPADAFTWYLSGMRALRPAAEDRGSIVHFSPSDRASNEHATSCLRRAVLSSPTPRMLYHLTLLDLAARIGDGETVEAVSDALLELWPGSPESLHHLAGAWVSRDAQRALRFAEDGLLLAPDLAGLHAARGRALSAMHRHAEALDAYERATDLDPHDPKTWLDRGVSLEALQHFDRALESYARAASVGDRDMQRLVHHNSVVCLGAAARHDEALSLAQRARDTWPDSPTFRTLVAMELQELGRHAEAERESREALAMDPGSAAAHSILGQALLFLGRHAEARVAAARAVDLDPACASAHSTLGVLLVDQDIEGAHDAFLRAAETQPASAVHWHNLTIARLSLHRWEEAGESVQRALHLDPTDAEAHRMLSDVYFAQGRLTEASGAQRAALELGQGRDEVWRSTCEKRLRFLDRQCLLADLEASLATEALPPLSALDSALAGALADRRYSPVVRIWRTVLAREPRACFLAPVAAYQAACAALLAARGADLVAADARSADARALRAQARAWLGDAVTAYSDRLAEPTLRDEARAHLEHMAVDDDLADVRSGATGLDPGERASWDEFWASRARVLATEGG